MGLHKSGAIKGAATIAILALLAGGVYAVSRVVGNAVLQMAEGMRKGDTPPPQTRMMWAIYETKFPDANTRRADVSAIVKRYLPIGTPRDDVMAWFARSTVDAIDVRDETLSVFHQKSLGFRETDRKSTRITLFFDADHKLTAVDAFVDSEPLAHDSASRPLEP